MKKILLVCAAGMSTSLLVNKMREAATKKGVEVDINALPVTQASEFVDKVDIILLGPQVRFQLSKVEEMAKGRIPVKVIDMMAYGQMNGEAVLNDALNLIK